MMSEPKYPFAPAPGITDTSHAGAEIMAPRIGPIQRLVLGIVKDSGATGATTDEIADHLEKGRPQVQPRTSELRLMGLIVDSGERRKNASGIKAIVWTLPEFAPKPEEAAND